MRLRPRRWMAAAQAILQTWRQHQRIVFLGGQWAWRPMMRSTFRFGLLIQHELGDGHVDECGPVAPGRLRGGDLTRG